MAWYIYIAVIAAGFAAGFINTLAGSGSLVTLPLLIAIFGAQGIPTPAKLANGTNRVGILLQNVVGTASFNKKNALDKRGGIYLGIPAVLGSIVGAQIAVSLNEVMMRRIIGAVMVLMLTIILLRPKRWLHGKLENITEFPNWKILILMFLTGVYGGLIQAGVGIFLLSVLVLGIGYNLVRANAVKVSIVLFFTLFALIIFVRNGDVNWVLGLVLSIGNMLGAWVGTKFAVEKGAIWVRRFLILVVTVSALNLLGIFDLITQRLNL
jgi:uncharacterized membrane protein YfcA